MGIKIELIPTEIEPSIKAYWRCEECGFESHTKPLPKDRVKFYANPHAAICPKCKSEALTPKGF